MNFPFYIARRYLFSKKSHNAINVISTISVCGVALATLALVCTLSVFNGFQDLVETFFTAFDPQLKITAVRGKVFDGQDKRVLQLKKLPEVAVYSESLEDNVMVQYQGRQAMAVIKGVEDNFDQLTPIDSILFGRGDLLLLCNSRHPAAFYFGVGYPFPRSAGNICSSPRCEGEYGESFHWVCDRQFVFIGSGLCCKSGEIRCLLYTYFHEFCP